MNKEKPLRFLKILYENGKASNYEFILDTLNDTIEFNQNGLV